MRNTPIELDFLKASGSTQQTVDVQPIKTFTSYQFERNILVPASAFRFTAPGVDASTRQSVRSGDTVSAYLQDNTGGRTQVFTGFIDETDTHVTPNGIEYVLTGRDTLGQLVDNDVVDANNSILNSQKLNLFNLLSLLITNTRIPPGIVPQQVPNGTFVVSTTPGETKISLFQKYLEYSNTLVWTMPDGRLKLGRPNFTQITIGNLYLKSISNNITNNILEARVRRNTNQAIRQIVSQMQTFEQVNPSPNTFHNNDVDVYPLEQALVGRSVYRVFSYSKGEDAINTFTGVGNQANPNYVGASLSLREIARENVKVLDVEVVLKGHLNEDYVPYNIDQVYNVQIDADDVNEDMYVYSVSYELTIDHGMLTRLRLCRLGTIVAYGDATQRQF